MTNLVKRLARNTNGRDIIVGDVHGCFTKLQYALAAIGFNHEGGDRLIHVGDLVDRGPESHWVVEWLAQPWVHSVAGNHEDMAIRWPNGHMDWGNYAANGGSWMMELDRATQLEVAAALSALPIVIELETSAGLVGIVHAECPISPWQDFTGLLENPNISSGKRQGLIDQCQWSRTRIGCMDETNIEGVVAVVVGHTPMERMTSLGNTLFIDTMGWRRGHFTLIDAATLRPAEAA